VNFWNSLPEYAVTADSVNTFKGRFDKCCSYLRFSTDANDFWPKPEISQQALSLKDCLFDDSGCYGRKRSAMCPYQTW